MKRVFLLPVISFALLAPAQVNAAMLTSNPYGTSTIDPAAPNETILVISKGSRRAEFASIRLNRLKSSEISIYEPFVKKREKFTVIPLKTFFTLVGISGRDKVVTRALNDYTFTAEADQFIAAGAYLAIKVNGKDIGYDEGGPIRIVFSDKSKWAKNLDAWNWSIASISVK